MFFPKPLSPEIQETLEGARREMLGLFSSQESKEIDNMLMTRQQRRFMKREEKKSKNKDVFFYVPDTEKEGFYLKLTLIKTPPKPLSVSESKIFFSKHGIARFCDERGVFLEIWMGSRRVRIGKQEDIDTFIHNYLERQDAEMPSDLTTQQLILGYATSVFGECYEIKSNAISK